MILLTCPDHPMPVSLEFDTREEAAEFCRIHLAYCGGHRVSVTDLETAEEVACAS